jgi:hypothetical protein
MSHGTVLNRSYITLHAHESNSKFTSLQHLDWEGTMYDLYNEFIKGRLGNSSVLSSRTIEIRLVYQKYVIVCKNISLLWSQLKLYLLSDVIHSINPKMSRLMRGNLLLPVERERALRVSLLLISEQELAASRTAHL